ncbi:MAG: GNAT family N-acetyltransferase [Bacteroidia bacterium]
MFQLHTSRLRLIPLNTEQLILFKNDRQSMQKAIGLNPSDFLMDPDFAKELNEDTFNYWIDHTIANPAHYRWFTNWVIILTEENREIGGIGVGNLPDEKGEVMTGYVIDDRYHNQGFASEALQALMQWMQENPDLKAIIADTPLDNYPSQRVLQKSGFVERSRDEEIVRWEYIVD